MEKYGEFPRANCGGVFRDRNHFGSLAYRSQRSREYVEGDGGADADSRPAASIRWSQLHGFVRVECPPEPSVNEEL